MHFFKSSVSAHGRFIYFWGCFIVAFLRFQVIFGVLISRVLIPLGSLWLLQKSTLGDYWLINGRLSCLEVAFVFIGLGDLFFRWRANLFFGFFFGQIKFFDFVVIASGILDGLFGDFFGLIDFF